MSESVIKLFNDESADIAMPSADSEKNKELIKNTFGNAIDGDIVQKVLVTIKSSIAPKNYVLDFSNVGIITIFQKEALKSLVYKKKKQTIKEQEQYEEPELITIYMARTGKDLTELGKGERYYLEKALPLLKSHIFADDIVVYKDFKADGSHIEIISDEKVNYRLNL